MTDLLTIKCRAQVSANCLDGKPTSAQFGDDPDDPTPMDMSGDGTFDGSSIVCDPCYVRLMPLTPSGQGLNAEMPAAIAAAQERGWNRNA